MGGRHNRDFVQSGWAVVSNRDCFHGEWLSLFVIVYRVDGWSSLIVSVFRVGGWGSVIVIVSMVGGRQ